MGKKNISLDKEGNVEIWGHNTLIVTLDQDDMEKIAELLWEFEKEKRNLRHASFKSKP